MAGAPIVLPLPCLRIAQWRSATSPRLPALTPYREHLFDRYSDRKPAGGGRGVSRDAGRRFPWQRPDGLGR